MGLIDDCIVQTRKALPGKSEQFNEFIEQLAQGNAAPTSLSAYFDQWGAAGNNAILLSKEGLFDPETIDDAFRALREASIAGDISYQGHPVRIFHYEIAQQDIDDMARGSAQHRLPAEKLARFLESAYPHEIVGAYAQRLRGDDFLGDTSVMGKDMARLFGSPEALMDPSKNCFSNILHLMNRIESDHPSLPAGMVLWDFTWPTVPEDRAAAIEALRAYERDVKLDKHGRPIAETAEQRDVAHKANAITWSVSRLLGLRTHVGSKRAHIIATPMYPFDAMDERYEAPAWSPWTCPSDEVIDDFKKPPLYRI